MKIIGEIAQGFEGDLVKAKLLVKAAAHAGADIAKIQLIYADEIATPDYIHYTLFKALEMPESSWKELVNYAEELNIELNFDVFGKRGLRLCENLGIKGIKLHGTDTTNVGLLKEVALSKIDSVYLGVGGSNLDEIELALSLLKDKNITLLLGFQSYPTPNNDNQISRIAFLRDRIVSKYANVEIGFADHAEPNSGMSMVLSAASIGAGASVLEKHLTLGKIMVMEDHESALNPDEFKEFVDIMKNCYLAFGRTVDRNDFGMSDSEKKYREAIRRHVTSSKSLEKGQVLTADNLVLKRTASKKVIYDITSVYGKVLKENIDGNKAIDQSIIE